MLFTTLKVGDTEYKLRLNAKNAVALERALGKHPLTVLMELQNENFPRTEETCAILHAALQCYHHGMNIDKVYDLYDNMIEEGKTIADILLVLMDIFKTAGFIPEDVDIKEEAEVKNA